MLIDQISVTGSQIFYVNVLSPQENLQNGLRSLLSQLPKVDEKSCISFFTNNALQTELQFFDIHHEKEDGQRWRRPSPGEAELHCLQALLSHTVLPRHRKLLVEKGVLPLLQRVVQEHPQDIQLHSLVAQMVANLALDSALHRPLFRAGGTLTLSVVFKLLYLLIKSKLQVCWSVCVTCDLILC